MFARVHGVALLGALGQLVDLQADVSSGTPGTTIVGRADAMLNEGRDRSRMAVQNSGLEWPTSQRVTILLSPADLPKFGTHYDLAMAISVLAATGVVPPGSLSGTALIGELSLDGGLRSVAGVLPMVLAAERQGVHRVIVPEPQAAEAAMVAGVEVLGLRSLAQVVAELNGDEVPWAPVVPPLGKGGFLGWRGQHRLDDLDMADLRGLDDAKFAIEVAAAGGHHILLSGAKGCGKTSLAERIPGILPDLDHDTAVELMALRSLAGRLDPSEGLVRRPPYAAPHHDASKGALVGGGSGKVSPGQLSLAHGGVVFLDEFPLFQTDAIDALREPMESGEICVSRMEETLHLPARAMIVLASNPCPCGDLGNRRASCQCSAAEKRNYQKRIRGPIYDRLDITRLLQPPTPGEGDSLAPARSSAEMRFAVAEARARQASRYAGTDWRLNSEVPGATLRERWPLPGEAERELRMAVSDGTFTNRAAVRTHRLAWTVADLLGLAEPGLSEVRIAMALRTGAALNSGVVQRRLVG
ncbi:YifB family Mg chelatase-like AAA ATPase [Nocardioides sp. Kera G14]|uniref:YifB family Mg chelatase-like AAA ATPase n=1 Tax=Nocardioides sp. Kera G14 TaxID=2884264 RepID=UPI001D11FE6F|nr:YifB family Mg chelatase-like AAA ATPase [Nocardioides sp. Kera G14]UDY22635.1 YifB family Mg chelatase-like AAA ATPase [Nocardioides sp. Kera G14]